jgi:CBS domain-containing protein
MQMEHLGALVVSRDGRALEGIIDERDIVRAYVRYGVEIAGKSVGDLMREEVVTCAPDEPVRHVMAKMTRHRVRHVPVLDGQRLAGIVSIGDVVKWRLEELELEKDVMRDAYMART